MNHLHTTLLFTAIVLCVFTTSVIAADTEKLLDTTLYESNEDTFRWSEASTINLDDQNHLFMAVTLFGGGGHDNSEARIVGFHSYDGGVTWPGPDEAVVVQENVGEENVMSPALLKLDNGDILCFVNVKNSIEDCGPWVKRSTDEAKTWSELQRLPYEGYGGVGSDRALQLSTGRVVLPCWVSLDSLGSTRIIVYYSDDRGETWQKSPIISTPKGSSGRKTDPAAEEPMVIELKDGRLMMIMRTYLKSIYKSYSDDGGATWSEPESSGIPSPGSMATIRRLPTGDILLIWNWALLEQIDGPWPRNFISTAISKDEGANFTSVRHLDGAADFEGKITMANVVFAAGDKAVITYSKSLTKKNAYNWRLQVMPVQWFYEGDYGQIYGESYLPRMEAAVASPVLTKPDPAVRKNLIETKLARFAPDTEWQILSGAWHFESDDGNHAIDTSRYENDLVFVRQGEFPRWADGPEGRSVQFDGGDGMLAAADAESLHFPDNRFTVEALIYPEAEKEHAMIVTKEHQLEVALLNGVLKAAVRCHGGWGPGWVGDSRIPLNEWTRIAVTFDGRYIRTYVNGGQTGKFARSGRMDVTGEPLVVGNCTNIEEAGFPGHIDELMLWQDLRYETETAAAFREDTREPRAVDNTHQLFIDDTLIGLNDNLERIVNPPLRDPRNPVLTYEHPWEGNCVITWGSVLYDAEEKLFKVWYEAYKKFPEHDDSTLLCYATSKDGVHWDKPNLGIVDYLGSTENNIVYWPKGTTFDAPSVVAVPNPTAEVKYRMYYHAIDPTGIRTATSPDGIHWEFAEGLVVEAGDRSSARYDAGRGKYQVFTRIPGREQRTVGLWESDDGVSFEHVGELLAADAQDPEKTELYGMIAFEYEGLRLGFLEPFFIPTRTLNTQLAYSRDGLEWHRACDRQTFLELGPNGSWDQCWVTPSHNPPVRVGDTLYIFYQGRSTLHWAEPPYGHIGSVGLAYLRPDGFVSLDAIWEEGAVTTCPVLLHGETLHVNASARPGYVVAEITALDGTPLEGFTRDDGVPLENKDVLDHAFLWKDGKTLGGLADTSVRVRFYLRGAKLFSFWTE